MPPKVNRLVFRVPPKPDVVLPKYNATIVNLRDAVCSKIHDIFANPCAGPFCVYTGPGFEGVSRVNAYLIRIQGEICVLVSMYPETLAHLVSVTTSIVSALRERGGLPVYIVCTNSAVCVGSGWEHDATFVPSQVSIRGIYGIDDDSRVRVFS